MTASIQTLATAAQAAAPAPARIVVTHPERPLDRKALAGRLAHFLERGSLTERDEALLEYLRETHVLSLDQVHRLLRPGKSRVTTYNRLQNLQRNDLLAAARIPREGMKDWRLPACKVYALGEAGRMWLKQDVDGRQANYLKRDQVLHDLLAAEIMVRLEEAVRQRGSEWSMAWAGEQAAAFVERLGDNPLARPDGLAVLRQQRGDKMAVLPLFVEMDAGREPHGRPSSDWGRKIIGYDRFYGGNWRSHPRLDDLPIFPMVAVITHGEQRLLNLAKAIAEHRKQPVTYYLAHWLDLCPAGVPAGDDFLSAPAWMIVPPEGEPIGAERTARRPLVADAKKKARKAKAG
jgi:DNA-binding PadR family transcriptional regulator